MRPWRRTERPDDRLIGDAAADQFAVDGLGDQSVLPRHIIVALSLVPARGDTSNTVGVKRDSSVAVNVKKRASARQAQLEFRRFRARLLPR
jgi:hypothetical protein